MWIDGYRKIASYSAELRAVCWQHLEGYYQVYHWDPKSNIIGEKIVDLKFESLEAAQRNTLEIVNENA